MNARKIVLYCLLAYAPTWIFEFGFFALGGHLQSAGFVVTALAGMYMPALAAVITQKFVCKRPLRELGLSEPALKFVLLAWILPLVMAWASLLVAAAFPQVSLITDHARLFEKLAGTESPGRIAGLHRLLDHGVLSLPGMFLVGASVQVLVVGISLNALAAFGEELGWRGLLGPELAPMGFWRSSFLTGVIWGVWHVPLIVYGFNYPGHPVLGPILMTVMTVLLSPLLAFIRERGRSVLACAVFHGTFNSAAGLVFFTAGGDATTVGMTGASGFVVLAAADGLLAWHLSRHPIRPRTVERRGPSAA